MEDFTTLVHAATRKIPEGKVCTYGAIASHIGKPKASRAVGMVLRKNPYGIESGCDPELMVPCHRVVGASRNLCGFFGKTDDEALGRKRELLENEGVDVDENKVAPACVLHKLAK